AAAAHAIAAGLPEDAVVVEEAITSGHPLRSVLRLDRPRSYVHTVGGGLGWGIGAAIGTRLGDPSRPVVAVIGDGSAMFGVQGLWTATRHDVPVTFVIMNNGEYRTLKETLDSGKSRSTELGRYVGLDLAPPTLDWSGAGTLFSVPYVRAESSVHLRDLIATPRTESLIIDVPIHSHRPSSA
ncbi:MAG: thiamine pyrophosphate-dependent enzyme, partial [Micromonosporaceae bacterium]